MNLLVAVIGSFFPSQQNVIKRPSSNILLEPIPEIVNQIKRGQLKSVDLIRAIIQRTREVNPHINALVAERFEEALAEAEVIDQNIQSALSGNDTLKHILDKPLLGIPFTVKDSIAVKGLPVTTGCTHRKGITAEQDATAVQQLRSNGGKSQLQGAMIVYIFLF